METINEYLILISTVAGMVSTFFIFIWKLFKRIDAIQEEFKDNTIATLRLVIVNEHLPIDERIKAGEKYISMGGNGSVKKIVKQLEEECADDMLH